MFFDVRLPCGADISTHWTLTRRLKLILSSATVLRVDIWQKAWSDSQAQSIISRIAPRSLRVVDNKERTHAGSPHLAGIQAISVMNTSRLGALAIHELVRPSDLASYLAYCPAHLEDIQLRGHSEYHLLDEDENALQIGHNSPPPPVWPALFILNVEACSRILQECAYLLTPLLVRAEHWFLNLADGHECPCADDLAILQGGSLHPGRVWYREWASDAPSKTAIRYLECSLIGQTPLGSCPLP